MKLSDLIKENILGGGTTTAAVGGTHTPPVGSTTKRRKYNGDVVNGQIDVAGNDPSFTQKGGPTTDRKTQFRGDVLNGKEKTGVPYTTEEIRSHLKDKLNDDTLKLIAIFKNDENRGEKK